MVKQLLIHPEQVRRSQSIEIGTIPVNQYSGSLSTEISGGNLTREDALNIYRDMLLIRGFEQMLGEIKKLGSYRGVSYDHKGPAHLSVGQEAAAVGEAFLLDSNDHIYGSHRSHGEIIAKGMSAVEKSEERR